VTYAFIERHRRDWPVSIQCSTLGVSTRGFQQYLHRKKMADKTTDGAGRVSDMALLTHRHCQVVGCGKVTPVGVIVS
jgi:putative transposase